MQLVYLESQIREGSWLQIATAFSFCLCALFSFNLQKISLFERLCLSFGFLWLAGDELLMAHECLKIFLSGTKISKIIGVEILPFYLIIAVISLWYLRKSFIWTRSMFMIIGLAGGFAALSIYEDFFNIGVLGGYLEEFSELAVGVLVNIFLYLQPRITFKMKNFFILILIFCLQILVISATKSKICERIFYIKGIHYWGPFPYQ